MTTTRFGWLRFWGNLANLAGYPSVVREVEYSSEAGVTVKVRKSAFYTVVTVNGVDVYFYRLTGGIDGVGFNPTETGRFQGLVNEWVAEAGERDRTQEEDDPAWERGYRAGRSDRALNDATKEQ